MITLNLRLRKRFLIIWALCLWAFLAIFPPAYESYYPTVESREAFTVGMQNNLGMTAIYGPLIPPVSLGQIVMWEAGSQILLLASIMSVLLMVGLHRRSEHQGYTELQLSTGIPRAAPGINALATTALASVLIGVGCTLVLVLSGLYVNELPTSGAVAFGFNVVLTMIGSALVAALVLLAVNEATALTRVGLLTVAGSFFLRSFADSQEIEWLNWLSPLGWKYVIGAYVDDDFLNVSLVALICLLLALLFHFAEKRREYGRGLITLPAVRAPTSRAIRGPLHLQWLLHRGTIITWVVLIAVLTGFFLALTGSLSEWMETDESVGRVFDDLFGSAEMKSEFIAYVTKLCGILVATAGIQVVVSQRSAEKNGTVELMRSTGIRRWIPLGTIAPLAVGTTVFGCLGLYVGGVAGLATQDSTTSADYELLAPSALSQLAPTLLLTAIAIAIVGLFPRATNAAWAPVIISTILTLFGPLLKAPEWLINCSPFEYVVGDLRGDWSAHAVMAAATVALIAVGLRGAQHREVR